MPDIILKITVKNVAYDVPAQDETMITLAQQIEVTKANIASINQQLKEEISTLENLNNQYIGRYIYLNNGNFP